MHSQLCVFCYVVSFLQWAPNGRLSITRAHKYCVSTAHCHAVNQARWIWHVHAEVLPRHFQSRQGAQGSAPQPVRVQAIAASHPGGRPHGGAVPRTAGYQHQYQHQYSEKWFNGEYLCCAFQQGMLMCLCLLTGCCRKRLRRHCFSISHEQNTTSAGAGRPAAPSPHNSAHDLAAVQAASASYINPTQVVVAGESDLLQQDQRQHRIAARRHLAGQAPSHTSKIKTSQTPLMAQANIPEGFGAAPQPAAAVQSHAVFTNSTNASNAAHPSGVNPITGQSTVLPGAIPSTSSEGSSKSSKPTPRPATVNAPDVPSEPGTPQFKSASRKSPLPTGAAAPASSTAAAPANASTSSTRAQTPSNPPTENREAQPTIVSGQAATAPGEMPSGWIEVIHFHASKYHVMTIVFVQ